MNDFFKNVHIEILHDFIQLCIKCDSLLVNDSRFCYSVHHMSYVFPYFYINSLRIYSYRLCLSKKAANTCLWTILLFLLFHFTLVTNCHALIRHQKPLESRSSLTATKFSFFGFIFSIPVEKLSFDLL